MVLFLAIYLYGLRFDANGTFYKLLITVDSETGYIITLGACANGSLLNSRKIR